MTYKDTFKDILVFSSVVIILFGTVALTWMFTKNLAECVPKGIIK